MKFVILLTIIGIAGICYFGATTGVEGSLSDMVDCLDEMSDVLETVKDKETATRVLPRLQELAGEMQTATAEMANCIREVNPDVMQEIIVKYQNEIDEANERFTKEVMRVCAIPGVGMEYTQSFAFSNAGSSGST